MSCGREPPPGSPLGSFMGQGAAPFGIVARGVESLTKWQTLCAVFNGLWAKSVMHDAASGVTTSSNVRWCLYESHAAQQVPASVIFCICNVLRESLRGLSNGEYDANSISSEDIVVPVERYWQKEASTLNEWLE